MTDKPRLFRLVRESDETGISGTGHIADGVIFTDGTCALRWRSEYRSTALYGSFTDLLKIHGHGGKTRADLTQHPYDRGGDDATQDAAENCPFASIGGLEARTAPKAPAYITEPDRAAWLSGYIDACRTMYGEGWRACEFSWGATIDIGKPPAKSETEGAL